MVGVGENLREVVQGKWKLRPVADGMQVRVRNSFLGLFSRARKKGEDAPPLTLDEIESAAILAAHAVNVLPVVRSKLLSLTTGSCTCQTKSPDIQYHEPTCYYRLAMEALNLIDHVEVDVIYGEG